jgi:hypothetical protein
MNSHRDDELVGALTDLGTPAHRPGYRERLMAELERADWSRPARDSDSRPRTWRLLAAASVAVAAVALVVGVAVSRHTVQELGNPPVASAAEVAANVRTALSEIRTLSVKSTWSYRNVVGPPRSEWRQDWTTADWWSRAVIRPVLHSWAGTRILATADGRFRMDSPEDDPPTIIEQNTADQLTGVLQQYDPPMSTLYVTRDASLGPPDSWMGEYTAGWSVDVSFIRPANLQAMAHGRVGETTYSGRPALTVSCAIAPAPIQGLDMGSHLFDTVEYTVDRETWLVMSTSYLLRDQVVQQTSLSDVRVNEPLSDAKFQLSPPGGTRTQLVTKSEVQPLLHFRRVSFGEAAHTFSTPPLEPGALPQGFSPFAAAVADKASLGMIWTYTDGYQPNYWPPSRDATQLSYRSGFLRFLVTTRKQPAGGPLPADLFVADPFVTETAGDDQAHIGGTLETVMLSGGAWRGVTAYLVTPLLVPPHLWAWHDGTLVTVGGDLTRDELLDVANSLQPMQ